MARHWRASTGTVPANVDTSVSEEGGVLFLPPGRPALGLLHLLLPSPLPLPVLFLGLTNYSAVQEDACHVYNGEWLISRIHEDLSKISKKKTTSPVEKGADDMNRQFIKEKA